MVGAGASNEVSIPTGPALKAQIGHLIDFKYDNWGTTLINGDRLIEAALREHVRRNPEIEFRSLQLSCQAIGLAMPQAISIDNYLDTHRADANTNICGKVAISRAILAAEAASKLARPIDGRRVRHDRIEGTWYTELMRLVTENVTIDGLSERLSRIAFVVFNYDRALEHFLVHWIADYFRITMEEAVSFVSEVEIHHPYGMVGHLPWASKDPGVRFGETLSSGGDLLSIAAQIRTFTERMDSSSDELARIKACVSSSTRVVFLGFAFHQINMNLIQPTRPAAPGAVCFATAKGISGFASTAIRADITRWFTADSDLVHMKEDLTCRQLFDEYGRGLSMV